MSDQDNGLVKGLLNLGEERMSEVVSQLLANERFVSAMQGAITQGLQAKRSVDKNVSRLLDAANVPTLEDVYQLREKLQELEDLLGDVLDRVQHLDERISSDGNDDDGDDAADAKKASGAKKKATSKKKKSGS